jgi:hypothetical protein
MRLHHLKLQTKNSQPFPGAYFLAALLLAVCVLGPFPAANAPAAGGDQGASGSPPDSRADDWFLAGQQAFNFGQEERAAELLMAAARGDSRCVDLLFDERYLSWLPREKCSEIISLKPAGVSGDRAPCMLYRLGMLQKRAREKEGELAVRRAGRYYLRRAVSEFPDNVWAGEAALQLLEDGRCLTDAGYPDCAVFLLKGYEEWLSKYSESSRRFEVLKKAAENYMVLAQKYEEDRPWQSAMRSELCRGRALELAQVVVEDGPASPQSGWADQFIRQVKSSGQRFSILPAGATSESKKIKDREKRRRVYSFIGSKTELE